MELGSHDTEARHNTATELYVTLLHSLSTADPKRQYHNQLRVGQSSASPSQ